MIKTSSVRKSQPPNLPEYATGHRNLDSSGYPILKVYRPIHLVIGWVFMGHAR